MGVEANGWRKNIQGTTVTLKDPSDTVSTTGFGITAGLGYDLRVGDNISLTPVGNFVFGSLGNLRLRRQLIPNVQSTLLQLGLGVTFH